MANEDIIGITVNGETIATFYVPNVGHKLKAGEYQIVNVGGILEVSVALMKDNEQHDATEIKKEIPLEILKKINIPGIGIGPDIVEPSQPSKNNESDIVPLALPPKKPRKPRESKQKDQEETSIEPQKLETRAPEKVTSEPVSTIVVSGDVNDARLSHLKKLIGFYCKANNMNPKDITIEILKRDALDIVERDDDITIQAAIDSLKA
jgi:hypothetical protein